MTPPAAVISTPPVTRRYSAALEPPSPVSTKLPVPELGALGVAVAVPVAVAVAVPVAALSEISIGNSGVTKMHLPGTDEIRGESLLQGGQLQSAECTRSAPTESQNPVPSSVGQPGQPWATLTLPSQTDYKNTRGQTAKSNHGTWRSLVARLTGGQEVASSNLVVPTLKALNCNGLGLFSCAESVSNSCTSQYVSNFEDSEAKLDTI